MIGVCPRYPPKGAGPKTSLFWRGCEADFGDSARPHLAATTVRVMAPSAGGGMVFFGVDRVVGLSMTQQPAPQGSPVPYTLTGPLDAVEVLREVLGDNVELTAVLSPISEVTIVDPKNAAKIGVPKNAASFAFSYPFSIINGRQQEILEAVGRRRQNTLSAPPLWLELVLNGGFFYFDAKGAIAGVNALALEMRQAASLTLVGPYQAERRAGDALRNSGRLKDITVDSLRKSGFHQFGWVYKGEAPGGYALGPDHEQGAFVYAHKDGAYYYYQLYLQEQAASKIGALAALSGPMLQVSVAFHRLPSPSVAFRPYHSHSLPSPSIAFHRLPSPSISSQLNTALTAGVANARAQVRSAEELSHTILLHAY